MNRTRRGFLAALALLPGIAFFGRSRSKARMAFRSDVTVPAQDRDGDVLRPDPFKFRLGQRLRRKDDGHEGIVVERAERLTDRQTLAIARSYTLVTDEGLGEWSGFGGPEDSFEAVPTWYVYSLEC